MINVEKSGHNSQLLKEIKEKYSNPECSHFNFQATPNPRARYKDQHGLSVLPFEFDYFCTFEEYKKNVKQPRSYFMINQ